MPVRFPRNRRNKGRMRVLCVHGYKGILEEGEVYNVIEVTKDGNYLLEEVAPPPPFLSFRSKRFVPLTDSPDEEVYEDIETELEHY